MQSILRQVALCALFGAAMFLNGCGGSGDDPTGSSSGSSPNQSPTPPTSGGDFAPNSIGGTTINGHIGGTSTTWQIITTGGTSGSYSYSENGKYLDEGTYTWTKTSANSGMLALSPSDTTMELDYTAPKQGNYLYHANANYNEPGTFTTN